MSKRRATVDGAATPHDPVSAPAHYRVGSIEVLDFIEAWQMDFLAGNVVKYVARAPYKGNTVEDLKKARFYLDRLIARSERAEEAAAEEKPAAQATEPKDGSIEV
jgi:hypothetical protein